MSDARKAPLLPPEDAREAALFFVVAALCFLAVLTALATRAAYGAAEAWAGQVQGEMIVQLDDASELDAIRLEEALRKVEGVQTANRETRDDTEDLLKPWLGNNLPMDLPLPQYILLQTNLAVPDVAERVRMAAQELGYTVKIEIFEAWASDVKRTMDLLRAIGFVALALLATIVVSVIAFATHAALLARRDVVSVLHTCGATDRFISRLFEYRFFGLGLKAGLIGALFALFGALLLFFFARQSGDRSWLLPQMSPDMGTYIVLGMTPVLSAFVSMIAARITVSRALAELN